MSNALLVENALLKHGLAVNRYREAMPHGGTYMEYCAAKYAEKEARNELHAAVRKLIEEAAHCTIANFRLSK